MHFLGFRTRGPAILCGDEKGIWFDEHSRWERLRLLYSNAGPVLHTFLAGLSAEQGYLMLYPKREAHMISAHAVIVWS